MKLNIIAGFIFFLLISAGMSSSASAQYCGHWRHHGCGHHACCKDNDKSKDGDKAEAKDKKCKDGESCCKHKDADHHYWTCHRWCHHCCSKHETATCHHSSCDSKHECHSDCDHGYYYRGGGR